MKKFLGCVTSMLCLVLLALPCMAQEVSVTDYVKNELLPPIVGVLTSLVALLATISKIKSTLSGLKDQKELLTSWETKNHEQIVSLVKEVKELQTLGQTVSEAKEEFFALKEQVALVGEACSLLAGQNDILVKEGVSKEIEKLTGSRA